MCANRLVFKILTSMIVFVPALLLAADGNGETKPAIHFDTRHFELADERQLNQALQDIREDLYEALEKNPNLKPQVVVQQSSAEELDRPKLLLSLTRGVVSMVAVSWTLAVDPDVSIEKALAVGALPGLFSAGVQYNISLVKDFVGGGNTLFHKCIRWLGIELPFVATLSVVMNFAGVEAQTLTEALQTILLTSTAGLGSQGLWDIGVVDDRQNETRLVSDLKMLRNAFFSIAAATAVMNDYELAGYSVMGVMGALGLKKYIQQYREQKKKKSCAAVLT